MSFINCVNRAIAGGELDEEFAGRALKYYEKLLRKYQKQGQADAELRAAAEAAKQSEDNVRQAARRKLLQARAQKNAIDQVQGYTKVSGKQAPKEAGLAIFDSMALHALPGMEQIKEGIRGQAHSMLSSFIVKHRVGVLGSAKDKASLVHVVHEIFGTNTGNKEAAGFAKAWQETSQWLRAEYNKAGGRIAFRKDWGMPQSHDWLAIKNKGREDWKTFVIQRLDFERMAYGLGVATKEGVFEQLDEIYKVLSTNGALDVEIDAIGMGAGAAQHNKRVESRYLAFKDAEGWLEYQTKFGNADPFQTMLNHVDGMARDIAAMRKLGPNPNMGVEAVKVAVRQQFAEMGSDNNAAASIQNIWDTYTGVNNIPDSAAFARTAANVRATLVAAQLGSAVVSATSDVSFTGMTAHFNGMSTTKVLVRAVSLLKGENRQKIARLGFILEGWTDVTASQARHHDEVLSSSFFQKLAGGVLRASGLPQWTDTLRWAFQAEMLGFLADNVGVRIDHLPASLQKTLKRYQISADEWEVIRNTKLFDAGEGATFLRPLDITRRTDLDSELAQNLGAKVYSMLQSEAGFAVPTASLRAKATLGRVPEPGTVLGEAARSGLMYKNFPITILMTHMRRALDETSQGRAGYAASLLIFTTLAGAFSTQMKQLKDGKEPSDMTMPSFWGRAMLQGGGLGIFGDFIIRDHNRYGGGIEETFAGPPIAAVGDALRIGQSVLTGDAGKAVDVLSNYVPGRSLWYISAPYKRAFQDNLRALGDKRPGRRFNRMIKNRKRLENAGYWWEPGAVSPF